MKPVKKKSGTAPRLVNKPVQPRDRGPNGETPARCSVTQGDG